VSYEHRKEKPLDAQSDVPGAGFGNDVEPGGLR
jgi:hypothetical protein